jgi:hypothetical protein
MEHIDVLWGEFLVAEAFARADPYVRNGLVKNWHVREWTTVVGDFAATPVKPE